MSELKEEKETKEPLKVKAKKPTNLGKRENDQVFKIKINDKKEEDANDGKTSSVSEDKQTGSVQADELRKEEGKPSESPIKEVLQEEKVEESLDDHVPEKDYPIHKTELPENVEKLVSFMKETGGNMEDYIRLNADYSKLDNASLLKEYYSKTKPHLDKEEINFLISDSFDWDEDLAEDREKKKKTLAMKEEIAKAKSFLEDTKSKYYDEIKLRPGVTQDQQKAMDFFNRYNKEQEIAQQQHEDFVNRTKEYLNEDFEGFDISVGDKSFKYGVSNPNNVAEKQSNLNTFIGKFLDKDGNVKDHKAYHKAIYAARNVDTIAEHFYEQGKADAIKNITAKSNNVSGSARPTQGNGEIFINGLKVKAVNGVDSSKLKIKTKNKN